MGRKQEQAPADGRRRRARLRRPGASGARGSRRRKLRGRSDWRCTQKSCSRTTPRTSRRPRRPCRTQGICLRRAFITRRRARPRRLPCRRRISPWRRAMRCGRTEQPGRTTLGRGIRGRARPTTSRCFSRDRMGYQGSATGRTPLSDPRRHSTLPPRASPAKCPATRLGPCDRSNLRTLGGTLPAATHTSPRRPQSRRKATPLCAGGR